MTQKHDTLGSLFDDIADAIRAKTGSSAQIVADDFPDEIAAISGGGASGVVYITDEPDEHGGIVRHLTTDGATITDTLDAHGGTVRSITGAEVYLQVKTVTPGATQQVITPDAGYDALGKVIVEAGAGNMMIVEIVNGTADHTFAEIFDAIQDGTPVFLHMPTEDTLEDYGAYNALMPVVSAFKYNVAYRVLASSARVQSVSGLNTTFTPALYIMQAADADSAPQFYKILYPSASATADYIY